MVLIQTERLTKHYGEIRALHEATFNVAEGVTGLVGPNGAGKSTLIKIVLGLITANSGKASVFGLDSWKDRGKTLERVGVLHEKPRYPRWVTAREYLEYVAKLKAVAEVVDEIAWVSGLFGLADFIDRKIGTFSAGMVQRLGLAAALIGRPQLVILDEPTANLDPLGRSDVLTTIRQLRNEEDISFLISTHILSELERVCENVVFLDNGRVLAHGALSELISRYTSAKYLVKVDDPEEFAKKVELKTAAKLVVKDDFFLVDVEDADSFVREMNELVANQIIVLKELRPLSPTLEDVFAEVLRREAA